MKLIFSMWLDIDGYNCLIQSTQMGVVRHAGGFNQHYVKTELSYDAPEHAK